MVVPRPCISHLDPGRFSGKRINPARWGCGSKAIGRPTCGRRIYIVTPPLNNHVTLGKGQHPLELLLVLGWGWGGEWCLYKEKNNRSLTGGVEGEGTIKVFCEP